MNNKKSLYLKGIIILITIIQVGVLVLYKLGSQNLYEDTEVFINNAYEKSIKEIEMDLENIKNYSIENYYKVEESWLIDLNLEGLENILANLDNINKFYIKNYDFFYENSKSILKLTLKSK
ncbi:hypothetical protein [Clostridium chauvoei]|uniref:Uncharacterized protein n=2 Tax=Clostridium chauvoei TaxID=46867 RepID=A0A1U6JEQ0_9CLOT|nr:hypothetical protein [Clostridium chauvoei]ATD55202.1 hypothetical protein BTM20_08095 [Clostridium chauvoei]ATD57126.1 hypothetical protein BTM21_04950 [Clostridium chauvoei]MBX7279546.1 hypothetical protein [Clostridium chauvoei]MBX7281915.1 hypothetical protein [Clostridium chauvoei]MBX7284496.1 hypothetical protein [Clostridium chauvoei]